MKLQVRKKGENEEHGELERGEKGRGGGEQRWISSRQHEEKLCLRLCTVRMHLCLCLCVELVCIQNVSTVKSVCVNFSILTSHPFENHSCAFILIN